MATNPSILSFFEPDAAGPKMRNTLRHGSFLFLVLSRAVQSTPISNQLVGFVPSPDRGTIDLIGTSLGTLFLAVYSVLHLNVNPSKGWRARFTKKLGWMVTAMICPEIVMWIAIGQWEVVQEICKRGKEIGIRLGRRDTEKWNLKEYGFLATMGGFKVLVDDKYSSILCNGSILTALGVLRLEKIRGVPHLTKEMIMDKSKMDYLTKGFFVVQGVWFFAQIVARRADNLTITLLELTILAHTLCAVALWIFWWRCKPKDLNDPVSIRISPAEAAYLSYDCRFRRLQVPVVEQIKGHVIVQIDEQDIRDVRPHDVERMEKRDIVDVGSTVIEQMEELVDEEMEGSVVTERLQTNHGSDYGGWQTYIPLSRAVLNVWHREPDVPNQRVQEWENSTEYQKIRRIDKAFKKDGVFMLIPGQETEHYRWESEQPIHLSEQMIKKLESLPEIEGSQEYSELVAAHGFDEYEKYQNCQNLYLTHEVPNTPDPKLLSHRSQKPFNILLILVLAYSGLHAMIWDKSFELQPPTAIEKMWWETATMVIGVGGLLLWTLFKISARKIAWRGWIATVLGGLIFVIAVMRLFLVVEAFIGLRRVPASVYSTVGWIPLPHIS